MFLKIEQKSLEIVVHWLNGLIGYAVHGGKVVRILEWQVVPTGRPYEYNAIARVEIGGTHGNG
jgi:hypothetical protein